jgi:glycosyltransferase involved in cell wall biosynthesis
MTSYPISFIIPAFNCADTLTEAVTSIYDGNFEPSDEVIIVNDASTDSTQKVIQKIAQEHPGVITLRHKKNKGSAAAGRNTAIDNARNSLYFCLDADNILAPASIPRLKHYLLEMRADAASFGELNYFQDSILNVTHKLVYKENLIMLSDALSGPIWPGPSGNYMFTHDSWVNAGRYLESIGGAYDSWAFGIRQLATGTRMVTLKNSFYYHRHGHRSAFVRDSIKSSSSLVALQVLLPFIDLIVDDDVEYLMGPETRYTWFENLEVRPIRLKAGALGQTGSRVTLREISSIKRFRQRARNWLKCFM